jgi:hypothetical protein
VGKHVLPSDVEQEEHSNHIKNQCLFSEREPVNHLNNNLNNNFKKYQNQESRNFKKGKK